MLRTRAEETSDNSPASPTPLPYGTSILESSLKSSAHGERSISASNPVEIFELPNSLHPDTVSAELRKMLDQVEAFAVGTRVCIGFVTYEGMVEAMGMHVARQHTTLPRALFFGYESESALPYSTSDKINSKATHIVEAFSFDDYLPRCKRVLEHIQEGDIYQANLTARSLVQSEIHPYQLFRQLNHSNPVPYASYLSLGDQAMISASPERFFLRRGNRLLASPIKGTARLKSGENEQAIAEALQHSPKNRAELLMIVDLMRNDLGRIARPGSVQVEELYKTEAYARLVHLLADVSCELKERTSLADIFLSLSPGGSITGAPKRRAIELLQKIETVPRGIYTGAIGYVSESRTEFNIAIRTLNWKDGIYELHAGGGIVADSEPQSEFDELELKASPLLAALGLHS